MGAKIDPRKAQGLSSNASTRYKFVTNPYLAAAHGEAAMLNCSSPTPPALLKALAPVFNLSGIRPVSNLSTPTTVKIGFIMFGILGVVSALHTQKHVRRTFLG